MAGLLTFTGTIMKNLFHKPVTTKYPAEPIDYPERSRGHIEIEIDKCISCGMCVRCCPPGCLSVSKKEGTWTINRFDCIACGYCVQKCPKKCLHIVPGYQTPGNEKFEAVYQKSPEVLAAEAAKAAEQAKKIAAAKAARAAKAAAAAKQTAPSQQAQDTAANKPAAALNKPADSAAAGNNPSVQPAAPKKEPVSTGRE